MEMTASRPTMTFTFRIYRENFATLIGLVALVTIPLSIVNLILAVPTLAATAELSTFGSGANASQLTSTVCLAGLISIIIALLQFVLINAPVTYIGSENQMGRKVSMGEAFSATRPRFGTLAIGFVLISIVVGISLFATGFIGAICFPVFAVFGIIAYVAISTYAFLTPVLVLENVGASFGMNRAWSLGKARFWMVVAVGLSIAVLTFIIALAFTAAAQWVIYQVIPPTTPLVTQQIIETVLSTFINIFTVPLLPIAMTLLYYDTRTRLEGLDIALQSLGNPNARPWDVVSPGGGAGLNSKDWVNIIILIVGTIVVSIVFGAALAALITPFLPTGGAF